MTSFHRDDRLSPSARARLDDYVLEFADTIIAEASRLNPDDVVTSRDIGDAYDAVQARERRDDRSSESPLGPSAYLSGRSLFFPILSGVLSLLVAALLVTVWLPGGSLSARDEGVLLVAGLIAYVAAAMSLSMVFLAYMRARRERARAVRYAELGGRNTQVAYYLAEAMSSRSSNSDDLAYLTARFIPKWARLEDRLRRLAIEALGMPHETAEDYPIGPLLSELTRIGVLDQARRDEFTQILDVRNRLAHGRRASIPETQVSLDYMDVLEDFLDEHIRSHSIPDGWTFSAE